MGMQMDRGYRGRDRGERDERDERNEYDDRYRERYDSSGDRYDGWGGQSGSGAGSMTGRYGGGGQQDFDSVQRGYGGGYGGQRMGYGGERMGYRREDEQGYGYSGNRQDFERDPRFGARDYRDRDRDRDRDYGGTLGHVDRPYAMQRGNQWGTGGPFESQRGGHRGKGPSGYTRSDERIREDVHEALTEDDEIDASSIEVEVKDGEVTLSGQVPERRMKRLAEDCIERIRGIKDVNNHIRVQEQNEVGKNLSAQRGTNTGAMRSQSVSNAPEKDTDNGKRRGPSA